MASYQKLSSDDLKDLVEYLTGVVRKAGELILEGSEAIQTTSSQETGVGEKKNSVDLVTEYDVRVEELLQRELKAKYPNFML